MTSSLLLVGAGAMAVEYARVLTALGVSFEVIGRTPEGCRRFEAATDIAAAPGGLAAIPEGDESRRSAIVAVSVDQLAEATLAVLERGYTNVLVEKPGGISRNEVAVVCNAVEQSGARVLVAYNRRHYASVLAAERLVADDGGPLSFIFEFTEWADRVRQVELPAAVKRSWFLANSSHVADLAFFLGGRPIELHAQVCGGLDWHPAGSIFAGSGVTDRGALFSYTANWDAPGRWGVEVMTKHHRLVLRPLEELRVQRHGSTSLDQFAIDDDLDQKFKPGLLRQVEDFLRGGPSRLPTIAEQLRAITLAYDRISPMGGDRSR